jgi:hypothetical protein
MARFLDTVRDDPTHWGGFPGHTLRRLRAKKGALCRT